MVDETHAEFERVKAVEAQNTQDISTLKEQTTQDISNLKEENRTLRDSIQTLQEENLALKLEMQLAKANLATVSKYVEEKRAKELVKE